MLNVGVVGFGFAGKVSHTPVLRAVPVLRLTTIVQRHGAPDPRYPDGAFVPSVDELLSRPLDVVVVATPNTSHHPIAKQCVSAGRHVVVDKPFTTTLAEARELVELARKTRRVLSVYQERRYTGDFVTTQNVVSDGVLGRIVSYEAHFDRFRPELRPGAWREQPLPGSGVWFDLGPHLIDRKSTRLNSSHGYISYAVFCLKKKKYLRSRAAFNKAQITHRSADVNATR